MGEYTKMKSEDQSGMNSNRDVLAEMQKQVQLHINSDETWEPWGPLDLPDDYGDWEFYADRLKEQSKYGALSTLSNTRTAVIAFRDDTGLIDDLTDFDDYEAEKFASWLEEYVDKGSTVDNYISSIRGMASFYDSCRYYDGNPFSNVESRDDSSPPSPFDNNRVKLDIGQLIDGVSNVGLKNVDSIVVIVLTKTGIRISELCNIDDRDINIDHPVSKLLEQTPRVEIDDKPDTLFIDSNKSKESHDDSTEGNKRKVGTFIPIDDEMKQCLIWYILSRPRNLSDENPFFRRYTGERISTRVGSKRVVIWAKENGLHKDGRDEMDNVTAHRLRAFHSTWMVNQVTSDDINGNNVKDFVKYLRGDVGSDIIDTYIQQYDHYGSVVRSKMPKFGVK